MQGLKRKITYVISFELFGIAFSTAGLAAFTGNGFAHASVSAAASSLTAILWNYCYTTLFEAWESRQSTKGRSLKRRIVQAIGFECGLTALVLPFYSWWLNISILEAFSACAALIIFFMIYAFFFNWTFDVFFGLPSSAQSISR